MSLSTDSWRETKTELTVVELIKNGTVRFIVARKTLSINFYFVFPDELLAFWLEISTAMYRCNFLVR